METKKQPNEWKDTRNLKQTTLAACRDKSSSHQRITTTSKLKQPIRVFFLWRRQRKFTIIKLVCYIRIPQSLLWHCVSFLGAPRFYDSAGPTPVKPQRRGRGEKRGLGRAGERRGKRSVSRRRPGWVRTNDKREAKCYKTHLTYKRHHEHSHDVRIWM